MFSSIARRLGHKGNSRPRRPSLNPLSQPLLHADDTEGEGDDFDTEAGGRSSRRRTHQNQDFAILEDEEEDDGEVERGEDERDPLLPIFSAAHLGLSRSFT